MVLFNDASLHGQFAAIEPFRDSLRALWGVRGRLIEKGLHLKVCRSIRLRQVTPTENFNDLLGSMPREIRTRLLVWLDREGPFWDEERRHSENEYFECGEEVVTDTGAAEAAILKAEGADAWLFSIAPSNYQSNPLQICWRERDGGDLLIDIPNGWTEEQVEECTEAFERPFNSWNELLEWAERECCHLALSTEIEKKLPAQFFPTVANRSKVLLRALNKMVGHVKDGDEQSFNQMRLDWMHGDRARFSDSSESEFRDFGKDLTFQNPETGANVVCAWHGKIQTPQYRIHFEWPLPGGADKLFVAYIGPKITKR